MDRDIRQMRSIAQDFKTREADGNLYIEGYFAVFNSNYEIAPGLSESVAPGAFTDTLAEDIRSLIDHETRLVLGRTTAHTLELKQDGHGLFGIVTVNQDDQDAMNLYARVQRGDVNQCSFGFDIIDESMEVRDNGDIHWTLNKVRLYEVSIVTFPAYETTAVKARMKDRETILQRRTEMWRNDIIKRLKGGESNAEGTDD